MLAFYYATNVVSLPLKTRRKKENATKIQQSKKKEKGQTFEVICENHCKVEANRINI